MSDKDCLFCKIIAGEIPSEKVYEDDADDMRNQTIERYGLDEGTFDKYYKIIFGDEDGIE